MTRISLQKYIGQLFVQFHNLHVYLTKSSLRRQISLLCSTTDLIPMYRILVSDFGHDISSFYFHHTKAIKGIYQKSTKEKYEQNTRDIDVFTPSHLLLEFFTRKSATTPFNGHIQEKTRQS